MVLVCETNVIDVTISNNYYVSVTTGLSAKGPFWVHPTGALTGHVVTPFFHYVLKFRPVWNTYPMTSYTSCSIERHYFYNISYQIIFFSGEDK